MHCLRAGSQRHFREVDLLKVGGERNGASDRLVRAVEGDDGGHRQRVPALAREVLFQMREESDEVDVNEEKRRSDGVDIVVGIHERGARGHSDVGGRDPPTDQGGAC